MARERAKLTQAGLAEKIGHACTQENISKLERGNASGSEFTSLFAAACGIDDIWLATGEGEPKWFYLPAGTKPRDAYAASNVTCTRQPSAVAMFTKASSEKRDTRPRSKSLMRGCVTPH